MGSKEEKYKLIESAFLERLIGLSPSHSLNYRTKNSD